MWVNYWFQQALGIVLGGIMAVGLVGCGIDTDDNATEENVTEEQKPAPPVEEKKGMTKAEFDQIKTVIL